MLLVSKWRERSFTFQTSLTKSNKYIKFIYSLGSTVHKCRCSENFCFTEEGEFFFTILKIKIKLFIRERRITNKAASIIYMQNYNRESIRVYPLESTLFVARACSIVFCSDLITRHPITRGFRFLRPRQIIRCATRH